MKRKRKENEEEVHKSRMLLSPAKKLKSVGVKKVEKMVKDDEKKKSINGKEEKRDNKSKKHLSDEAAAHEYDEKRSKEEKKNCRTEKRDKNKSKEKHGEKGENGKSSKSKEKVPKQKDKQSQPQFKPATNTMKDISTSSLPNLSNGTKSAASESPSASYPASLNPSHTAATAGQRPSDLVISHPASKPASSSHSQLKQLQHSSIPQSTTNLTSTPTSNPPILKMSTPIVAALNPQIPSPPIPLLKSSRRDPTKPKKSVQFAPDTKPTDGNSRQTIHRAILGNYPSAAIVTPEQLSSSLSRKDKRKASSSSPQLNSQNKSLNSSDTNTKKKSKKNKKKKNPHKSNIHYSQEQINQKIKEESIQYLHLFHTSRNSWRFRKSRQNWILRNLFEFFHVTGNEATATDTTSTLAIPSTSENDHALKIYLASIQGQAARDRLLDEARKVISDCENIKRTEKEENLKEDGGSVGKDIEGDITMQDPDSSKVVEKVKRAELVLAALGHGVDDDEDDDEDDDKDEEEEKKSSSGFKKMNEEERNDAFKKDTKQNGSEENESDGDDDDDSDESD